MMFRTEFVKNLATGCGFSIAGIARAVKLEKDEKYLREWIGSGRHGNLGYITRDPLRRCEPQLILEGARSVIICAVNYKNEAWDQSFHVRENKISSYAYSTDYHGTIKTMLRNMVTGLELEYGKFSYKLFCDTAPLLEKAWAVEAGLGWRGKNSLLMTSGYGSFVFLGGMILDVDFDAYDGPVPGIGCEGCNKCRDACPRNALEEPYVLNAHKCISLLTQDPDGVSNKEQLHGWIYGCDICQTVCPFNRDTPMATDPGFIPKMEIPFPVMDHSPGELNDLFKDTPIGRFDFRTLKKN